jgi:hypothetical protein
VIVLFVQMKGDAVISLRPRDDDDDPPRCSRLASRHHRVVLVVRLPGGCLKAGLPELKLIGGTAAAYP